MPQLPSGLPEEIAADEDIARFLHESNKFSVAMAMARPAAFLPSKERETSVSRHGEEPADVLLALGKEAAAAANRKLYGAAIFKPNAVNEAQLTIREAEPPDRHAVIIGWPTNADPRMEKAKCLEHAAVFASKADLILFAEGEAV
jgi:hypothetical protein